MLILLRNCAFFQWKYLCCLLLFDMILLSKQFFLKKKKKKKKVWTVYLKNFVLDIYRTRFTLHRTSWQKGKNYWNEKGLKFQLKKTTTKLIIWEKGPKSQKAFTLKFLEYLSWNSYISWLPSTILHLKRN